MGLGLKVWLKGFGFKGELMGLHRVFRFML